MKRLKTIVGLLKAFLTFLLSPLERYVQRALLLFALPAEYPDITQFVTHLGIDPTSLELIEMPLFQYLVYPTAGLTNMRFFGTGIGQGVSSASPGNAGNALALSDTNLQGPGGQLPSPQMYYITGIQVVCDPGSSAATNTTFALQPPGNFLAVPTAAGLPQAGEADVNAILSTGSLQLNISNKPYYQDAPLYMMPPSAYLHLEAALASNSATTGAVLKAKLASRGVLRKINPGIGIASSMNFDVTLTWPVAVATPSGFNARLGVRFDGFQIRAAQ